MRIAGTHHRDARRMNETRRLLLLLDNPNQIRRRVDVDPSSDVRNRIDGRSDDGREMNDDVRRDTGNKTTHLFLVSQICQPDIDTTRQILHGLSVGWGVKVGCYDPTTEFSQSLNSGGAHQAETTGDKDGVGHFSPDI